MIKRYTFLIVIWIVLVWVSVPVFSLSLKEAEQGALKASHRLKSIESDLQALTSQVSVYAQGLSPHLALNGSYQYLTTIPALTVGGGSVKLGSNTNYSIGPVLTYTLWDNNAAGNASQGAVFLLKSRQEDKKATTLQILEALRRVYVQAELAFTEKKVVQASLDLAQAQSEDVNKRYRAGATTKLEVLLSRRQLLHVALQLKQKQADLEAILTSLKAFLDPAATPFNADDPLLDSLTDTLLALQDSKIRAPDEQHPHIQNLEHLAQASELQGKSYGAKEWPAFQVGASSTLTYPNGPVEQSFNQNAVFASFSMPLGLGDSNGLLQAQKNKEAESIRYKKEQTLIELNTDYATAITLIARLKEQEKLANQDVVQSEEISRLYFETFKAGKINLIDVQTADNQTLQAKLAHARIEAQLMMHYIITKTLSGKES